MRGTEACATAAQGLHHCMATNKMVAKPPKPQVRGDLVLSLLHASPWRLIVGKRIRDTAEKKDRDAQAERSPRRQLRRWLDLSRGCLSRKIPRTGRFCAIDASRESTITRGRGVRAPIFTDICTAEGNTLTPDQLSVTQSQLEEPISLYHTHACDCIPWLGSAPLSTCVAVIALSGEPCVAASDEANH